MTIPEGLRKKVEIARQHINCERNSVGDCWDKSFALDALTGIETELTRLQQANAALAQAAVRLRGDADAPGAVDRETIYLGLLWRHAAACFRGDDEEADRWADLAEYEYYVIPTPRDYSDGAHWMASCVDEWDSK